jgi:hypothetical protein
MVKLTSTLLAAALALTLGAWDVPSGPGTPKFAIDMGVCAAQSESAGGDNATAKFVECMKKKGYRLLGTNIPELIRAAN